MVLLAVGIALGGFLLCFFPLDGLVDFLAVNRDAPRGIYSQANLITADINDCDRDIVADDN